MKLHRDAANTGASTHLDFGKLAPIKTLRFTLIAGHFAMPSLACCNNNEPLLVRTTLEYLGIEASGGACRIAA
jgi:hypothetical protein